MVASSANERIRIPGNFLIADLRRLIILFAEFRSGIVLIRYFRSGIVLIPDLRIGILRSPFVGHSVFSAFFELVVL